MSLLKRLPTGLALAAIALLAAAGAALAQDVAVVEEVVDEVVLDSGDTAWMLTATALVLLMTIPGLAMFYAGMVRKKNVLATAMQSFAICCLVTILWTIIGYSLAFGDGGNLNAYIGSLDRVLLAGIGTDTLSTLSKTIPEILYVVFQLTFAIITPALITGAFADRMKFSAMLWFMGLWVLLVYVPICHWVWGGGFLGADGVLDFAGGTVVHINAGVAGLVTCIVIGRRRGFGTENMEPHNLVLSLIGASLLWVGWFGFNAGSAVAANGSAGMAMAVTQIAAATAAISWMFLEWMVRKKPTVLGIVSGAVGGLVAITPAAGFVNPTGALIIGFVAGIACFWGAVWLKPAVGYDDSLDAFGVHGVGGIVGALLTGVFAVEAIGGTPGLLEGNPMQMWLQLKGILVTIVYCAAVSYILLKLIDLAIGLRVDHDTEISGLDLALHGETVQ